MYKLSLLNATTDGAPDEAWTRGLSIQSPTNTQPLAPIRSTKYNVSILWYHIIDFLK